MYSVHYTCHTDTGHVETRPNPSFLHPRPFDRAVVKNKDLEKVNSAGSACTTNGTSGRKEDMCAYVRLTNFRLVYTATTEIYTRSIVGSVRCV